MAKEKETKTEAAEKLFPIEELKNKSRLPDIIFDGVCVAKGWKSGKQVSKLEFDESVLAWMSSPMGGKKNVKRS